jgi:hypothetical protein
MQGKNLMKHHLLIQELRLRKTVFKQYGAKAKKSNSSNRSENECIYAPQIKTQPV